MRLQGYTITEHLCIELQWPLQKPTLGDVLDSLMATKLGP
jgi:hypothetical protein